MGAAMEPTTKAERRLAATARGGGEAVCFGLGEEEKKIRPEFLRALILGLLKDATGAVIRPPGAVRLEGATIAGKLDLSLLGSAAAPLPGLILHLCKIEGEADLSGARLGEVDLNACHLTAFKAPRAHIDGQLMLLGLTLPEGAAIDLEDAVVAHWLNIERCTAEKDARLGTITLRGASIGGNLSLQHLRCQSAEHAIVAERAVVPGLLTLSNIDAQGEVSFSGARAGTLDDDWNRGWGDMPTSPSPALAGEGRGGGSWPSSDASPTGPLPNPPPQGREREFSGVALMLDGFVYERIEIDGAHPPPAQQSNFLHRWRDRLFYADRALIETRLACIDRMYRGEAAAQHSFFPQPYRELAATLRDMGRGYAARRILYEMEKKSLLGSPDSPVSRFCFRLYGAAFGFGYSSWRATGTVLALWLFATAGFAIARQYETLGQFLDEPTVSSIYSSPPLASATSSVAAKGLHPAALKKIFASEQGPHDWAPPCDAPPWLYAIDAMLPIIDLGVESGCGFLDGAWGWHLFKLFVAIAGGVAIPLAALTFTGLLQRA
jgi:hypothetical protein